MTKVVYIIIGLFILFLWVLCTHRIYLIYESMNHYYNCDTFSNIWDSSNACIVRLVLVFVGLAANILTQCMPRVWSPYAMTLLLLSIGEPKLCIAVSPIFFAVIINKLDNVACPKLTGPEIVFWCCCANNYCSALLRSKCWLPSCQCFLG